MSKLCSPLISICIPVYNVEKFLCECLDSIVNQTLSNIEIICVNDGSTDSSLQILECYANKDKRIKVINFASNKSVLQARKAAVEIATGLYIMFVDSDDSLELNACEKLYSYMNKCDIDILHFGTFVDATTEVNKDTVRWFENFAVPYNQVVYDDDILFYSFRDRKIIWNLWNKIYRTDVVKTAFLHIGEFYLNMCEDMYAFFLIAYSAKSYFGIEEKFYHYRFGAGITGRRLEWNYKKFTGLCQMGYIVTLLEEFAKSKNKEGVYSEIFSLMNRDFLNSALSGLSNLSSEVDRTKSMELYVDRFGKQAAFDCVVTRLNNQEEAIYNLENQLKIANQESIKFKRDIDCLNKHIDAMKNTSG